jgi:hypothetical protein
MRVYTSAGGEGTQGADVELLFIIVSFYLKDKNIPSAMAGRFDEAHEENVM